MAPMVGEVELAGEGVSIEPITRQNVLALKAVRLCALQDAPTAFSSYEPTTISSFRSSSLARAP